MTPPTLDELRSKATAAELTLINAVEARVRHDLGGSAEKKAFDTLGRALDAVGPPHSVDNPREWATRLRETFQANFTP